MTALISDIHANLKALEAVLKHIDAQDNVERIFCLGDVVGYGPDLETAIDLVKKRCEWSLMGNHDCAMVFTPFGKVKANPCLHNYCEARLLVGR